MKKNILFAALTLLGVLSLVSCSKKHECICTINGETKTHSLEDMEDDEAEEACTILNSSAKAQDSDGGCEL